MKDYRWNTVSFLLLRISQLVLGVIVLGISAYFVSKYEECRDRYVAFTLAVGGLTLLWMAAALSLFYTSNLLPLAAIIADVVLAVAYIVSIATIADDNPDAIAGSCTFYTFTLWSTYTYVFEDCNTLRGVFGILILEMLTFIGAIIWDGIVLYQNRHGGVGGAEVAAHNAMHGGGQEAAMGGMYGMPKPVMDAANGENYGPQTYLPQYQPTNSPIYPAQFASPAAPYDPYMPPPTLPQQAVMMPHHQHQQIHQVQQHQQQQSPHHHHQQQQKYDGPAQYELGGGGH
ncbi:hypothetical protein C7212DRAFT_365749 [Tuber magnatum]|uniref:MARVEL domain-containing protein n=1 Tax=Tuber magnatum TaxID=42249 RepID=A0A317SGT3_9PEZI|nr:hypothetical protein C7212DRAFT_365749 [Tuber magnatum]